MTSAPMSHRLRLHAAEKLPQHLRRHIRIFLRQKMPAIDRRAAHIGRPVLPGIERRRRGAGDAGVAPQRQHRDRDLLARVAIGLVDLEIGIGAGAIILAHRMQPRGIAERREIMLQRARIDGVEIFRLGLARHLLLEEEIRIAADQGFRQRKRLRQKGPVIDLQRVEPVHPLPVVEVGRISSTASLDRRPG